ncbi:MAG: archaeosine biosynthesis radical SAM protein RaSEA [Candidatus Hodarchaeales archaeon]
MPYDINEELSKTIYSLRQEYLHTITYETPKLWGDIEKNDIKNVVTIVIPSHGCSWALSEHGGCSVCGYVNDASRSLNIPIKEIIDKLDELLQKSDNNKPLYVKIFNSGSFFDEPDVPSELRNSIIELLKKYSNCVQLDVESRSEYVIKNISTVDLIQSSLKPIQLEVGLGLESFNDAILRDCWNKGMTFGEYQQAIDLLKSHNIKVKTYVFLKPPFLTEAEAIADILETIDQAINLGTDVISINPCAIQNGTLVNSLFKQDKYQPPWLWSVLFVVEQIKRKFPNIEIICDPTAGGKPRGAHNCGKCDRTVLRLIEDIIRNDKTIQDYSNICNCYSRWKTLMSSPLEHFRKRNISKLRTKIPLNE